MYRVLIITYYWPPGGGAGVQRWLKFVKYLHQSGWEPVVYTVDGGEMPSQDTSLLKDIPEGLEVLKQPIWEPYDVYKKILGQKKEEKINTGFLTEDKKPKFRENLSVWVRGNFFIPDARKFWIKPSAKFLQAYLKDHPVDLMVSTGPPHSMHLIALAIKQKMQIKWVADFRDPWTKIDFYKDLKLTALADRKHKRLEKQVLKTADKVLAVGETLKDELEEISNRRVDVITNGFDADDVMGMEDVSLDSKFTFAHIGTLVKSRNHPVLWEAIAQLIKENSQFEKDLKIRFVGKLDVTATEDLRKFGLTDYVEKIDYLPHNEVMKLQRASSVLFLSVNNTHNAKGILTGKIFEYLNAGRPVFAIGPPNGDLAKILKETNAGYVFDFTDLEGMKKGMLRMYHAFKENKQLFEFKNVEKFNRKEITTRLIEIFQQTIKE